MPHRSSKSFVPAAPRATLSTGQVTRILRDLKGWIQAQLAVRSGISPTNISLLENDKVDIGKKRAQQLSTAFDIHRAIIMFPEYEAREIAKVACRLAPGRITPGRTLTQPRPCSLNIMPRRSLRSRVARFNAPTPRQKR
jgi:transcriptional regulator with XRE-family HTH domain